MIFSSSKLITGTVLFTMCSISSGEEKAASAFELTGSVQIQGQKALWDNSTGNSSKNNLDEFWGRANFGAKYKSDKFSSELNIRAYPEGWGYEPLTGLVMKDSTDTVNLSTSKTSIAKFQIEQAWVNYHFANMFDFKIGRFYTTTSKTLQFGSYIDLNAGGGFISKVAYHNAIDFSMHTGLWSSSIMLGAGDKFLNTGYLRILEQVTPVKPLTIGAGYRVNVFDLAYDENAEMMHRISFLADFDFGAVYTKLKDLKPYAEVGMIKKTEDKYDIPFTAGITIPTAGILSTCALEMEYLKNRKVKEKDVPVQWNLYIDRKIGKIVKIQASIFTDALAPSVNDTRLALRFTSSIK